MNIFTYPETRIRRLEVHRHRRVCSKNECVTLRIIYCIIFPAAFNKEIQEETHFTKCLGNIKIFPHIELSEAVKKNYREADFTALVKMSNQKDPKVCDHDTYYAASLYKLCGTTGVVDLLPPRGPGQEWMDTVKEGEGAEGM